MAQRGVSIGHAVGKRVPGPGAVLDAQSWEAYSDLSNREIAEMLLIKRAGEMKARYFRLPFGYWKL